MKKSLKGFIILSIIILISFTGILFHGYPFTDAATQYYPMKVNYIDVGESDSVLIQSYGKSILIDAGDTDDTDEILDYLHEKKIQTIDYLILTHPHADHIAGADEIINKFKIGKIIMPNKSHTTKAYKDVLNAIKSKGLKITKPIVGDVYKIGKAKFTILSPNNYEYGDNLNNYSVAVKLVNGKDSFLFIGDNETEAIDDILSNKININTDVLMCGHHGSETSTTSGLVKAISPTYAVISVGNNNYGHPSDETMQILSDQKVKIYRTDENGTITATSTGTKITIDAKPTTLKNTSKQTTQTVYITKTGKKYHLGSCPSLSQSKIKINLKDAKAKGYTACLKCNPPN